MSIFFVESYADFDLLTTGNKTLIIPDSIQSEFSVIRGENFVEIESEGNFPDFCYSDSFSELNVDQNEFKISISKWAEVDLISVCVKAIKKFSNTYIIPANNLQPGSYTVRFKGKDGEWVNFGAIEIDFF